MDEMTDNSLNQIIERIDAYKPPVKTPFDHVCDVALFTFKLYLLELKATRRGHANRPQDRGS